MPLVVCPKCAHEIQLDRSVDNLTLRCRRCGTKFNVTSDGTSFMQAEPTGPAQQVAEQFAALAAEDTTEQVVHVSRRKRKRSLLWAIAGGLGCLAGLLTLVYAFWYYLEHPYLRIEDPLTGQVVFDGRVSLAEKERLLEEHRRKAAAQDVMTDEPLLDAYADAPAEPELRGDAMVAVTLGRENLRFDPQGGAYGTGTLANTYKHALKSVKVTAIVHDDALGVLAERTITLRWIPALDGASFSMKFDRLSSEEVDYVETFASDAVPLGAKELCLAVPAAACRLSISDGKVVLSGQATNDTEVDLTGVAIFCDFFTDRGIFVKSVKGSFYDEPILNAGTSRGFFVSLDPTQTGHPAKSIVDFSVRLVGVKADQAGG